MWFQTYGYYQLIVYNDQELEYDPYHYGYVTTKNSDEWNCTRKDWIIDDFSRLETSVYRGLNAPCMAWLPISAIIYLHLGWFVWYMLINIP